MKAKHSSGPPHARRIVFLAAPPVEELDVVGPWEVFATANNALGAGAVFYHLQLLTTQRRRSFPGDSGLRFAADAYYKTFAGPADTLVIAGGSGAQAMSDAGVLRWLCAQSKKARRLVSICTGAFLLARAGLLEGKRATTHWNFAAELARQYPGVSVEPDQIYVQDSGVYTSAGVTAGIDLALALVEEDLGSGIALRVAQNLVLFLCRPGGQAQFSALLSARATECRPIRELLVWIAQNLAGDLSVDRLAAQAAMSPRNFARVFQREVGVTPAHFVERLRLEAARRSLETSAKSLEEIAAGIGFTAAESMRRAFQRSLGVSPRAYRERFQATSAVRPPGRRQRAKSERPRRNHA